MKRLLAVLAVVALVGSGAFALASAQEEKATRHGHSDGMGGRMGGMMMGRGHPAEQPLITLALENKDQLGLTPDQVKALESLRSDFRKEALRQWAELVVAEIELADLRRADSVDLAKAEAKVREVEGRRADLRLRRLTALEKAKALLTEEQWKKLHSLSPRVSADMHGGIMGGRGMEEMQRFMQSERMPQAMTAMMGMARQMGDGDPMAGMVRMMEMMSMMGQMGGQMGEMMGPSQPQPSK